jgi:hypothetical protein
MSFLEIEVLYLCLLATIGVIIKWRQSKKQGF